MKQPLKILFPLTFSCLSFQTAEVVYRCTQGSGDITAGCGYTPFNQTEQQSTALWPVVMFLFKEQSQFQLCVFHKAGLQSFLTLHSLDAHHNDVCDSCQAGISSHQRPEEHPTGAKGQQCLGGDPEVSKLQ